MMLEIDIESIERLPVPLISRSTIERENGIRVETCLFDGQPAALVAHSNPPDRDAVQTGTADGHFTLILFDSAMERVKWLLSRSSNRTLT